MIVYELKEYPLLPITPSTELEDHSGNGYRYCPKIITGNLFCVVDYIYQCNGCIKFEGENPYSVIGWGMHNFDILKHRICIFSPGKYTRLRIVEDL